MPVAELEDFSVSDRIPPHDVELEQSVLGAMLLSRQAVLKMIALIDRQVFYSGRHREIYDALVRIYEAGDEPDLTLLSRDLDGRGILKECGGYPYLVDIAASVGTSANIESHARALIALAAKRRGFALASRYAESCLDSVSDIYNSTTQFQHELLSLLNQRGGGGYQHISIGINKAYESAERASSEKKVRGIRTGIGCIDAIIAGLRPGEHTVVGGYTGTGKCQPLDAQIRTADGWKRMGDIEIGDALMSIDGEPSHVIGVFPRGERDVYRITFSDGRSTECGKEHLWYINQKMWDHPRVVDTTELMRLMSLVSYVDSLYIPTVSGECGVDRELPIDPWLLGAYIGNGYSGSTPKFSSNDADTLSRVADSIGDGMELVHVANYDWKIVKVSRGKNIPNPFKEALKGVGLAGKRSHEKFIPPEYLIASKRQRLELMRGLIDTDGDVDKGGQIVYSTSSDRLAHDVAELARSLGCRCSIKTRLPHYTYRGERREGRVAYRCYISIRDGRDFISLPRKKERAVVRTKPCHLRIMKVEFSRRTATQCIMVDHPSNLYVTDDYIVTHNTTLCLNIANNIALTDKVPVGFLSLEMNSASLSARLLAINSGVSTIRQGSGELTKSEWSDMGYWAGKVSEAPLWVDDGTRQKPAEIAVRAQRLVQEHGVRVIFVDYLGLIFPPIPRNGQRFLEVSDISKELCAMAKELDIAVVTCAQIHRDYAKRAGPSSRGKTDPINDLRPTKADLRDSSAIAEDADNVWLIHRPEALGKLQAADGSSLVNRAWIYVDKARNGPTGRCELSWDGPSQRYRGVTYQGEEPPPIYDGDDGDEDSPPF